MSSYLPALEIVRTVITSIVLASEAGAGILEKMRTMCRLLKLQCCSTEPDTVAEMFIRCELEALLPENLRTSEPYSRFLIE